MRMSVFSGCIASLLFPVLTPHKSFAATPSADIESSVPGRSSDSNQNPAIESDAIESDAIESDAIESDTTESPASDPRDTESITFDRNTRFSCLNRGGEYTVMYQPESQPGQGFPWAIPQTLGGGWDAQSRCDEIARRLEEYRPDGLVELQTGTENGYNTLCATTEENAQCRIVLTVPPGQDPLVTRNSVFENLVAADTGNTTTGVTTYAGGNDLSNELINIGSTLFGRRSSPFASRSNQKGIRLKPYLDRADRGSGIALRNGIRLRSGKQLNPDAFRE